MLKEIVVAQPTNTIDVSKADIRKGILVIDTPGNCVGIVAIITGTNQFTVRFTNGSNNGAFTSLERLITLSGYKFIQYE